MDRFEEKFIPEPNSGCFLWTGGVHATRGYGVFRPEPSGKKKELAHRVAWERANGPIPQGMHICHHCDMPVCVNPLHLFLGTNADNHADKMRKGRQAKGPPHSMVMKSVAPNGCRHYKSSLTDDEVRLIRHEPGPLSEIAAKYSISKASACRIRSRIRYAKVTD